MNGCLSLVHGSASQRIPVFRFVALGFSRVAYSPVISSSRMWLVYHVVLSAVVNLR
jgi:hypothetical protein